MPRGTKKQINYDEEIMKIESQIAKHTNTISELKEKKSELLQQKRYAELLELDNYLKSKKLDISDLLKQVKVV